MLCWHQTQHPSLSHPPSAYRNAYTALEAGPAVKEGIPHLGGPQLRTASGTPEGSKELSVQSWIEVFFQGRFPGKDRGREALPRLFGSAIVLVYHHKYVSRVFVVEGLFQVFCEVLRVITGKKYPARLSTTVISLVVQ